jgi:hypothetical protein
LVLLHLADLEHEALAGELLVHRGIEKELHPGSLVEAVGRHAGNDVRRALRRLPIGAGVADAAVDPHPVEPQVAALGSADRQMEAGVPARLVGVAEGGEPPAGIPVGQVLGEELRHGDPQPVRQAEPHLPLVAPLAAERAIFEMVVVPLIGDGVIEKPARHGIRGRQVGREERAPAAEGRDGRGREKNQSYFRHIQLLTSLTEADRKSSLAWLDLF